MQRRAHKVYIVKKDVPPDAQPPANAERVGHFVKECHTPFVHAFWHVERVTDPEDNRINMIMSKEDTSQDVKLPVMTNKRKINKNEVLVLLVQGAPKAAVVQGAPKAAAAKPPAKKTRKA